MQAAFFILANAIALWDAGFMVRSRAEMKRMFD